MSFLDRLPQNIRELVLLLVSALLGYASDNVQFIPAPGYVVAMATGVLGWLAMNLTTITNHYGIGSKKPIE